MSVQSAIRLASTAFVAATIAAATLFLVGSPASAADKIDPVADAKAFQKYFTDKFPQPTTRSRHKSGNA